MCHRRLCWLIVVVAANASACSGGQTASKSPPSKDQAPAAGAPKPTTPTESTEASPGMALLLGACSSSAAETLELTVSDTTSTPIYDLAVEVIYRGTETISGERRCDQRLIRTSLISVADPTKTYVNRNNNDWWRGVAPIEHCLAMPSPYRIVPGAKVVHELAFRDFLLAGEAPAPPGDYTLVVSYAGCGTARVTIP